MERPERAVSKYWFVRFQPSGVPTSYSKDEVKAAVLCMVAGFVVCLSIFGVLVLLVRLIGITRENSATLYGSALLVCTFAAVGIAIWLSRQIGDWLAPSLMKRADENAARRFRTGASAG